MMLCGNIPLRTTSQLPTLNKSQSATTTPQQRQAAAARQAAKSKSKLWGPSHSFDSDDSSDGQLGAAPRTPQNGGGWWEAMNKTWVEWGGSPLGSTSAPADGFKRSRSSRSQLKQMDPVPEVEEEEEGGEESTDPSTQEDSNERQDLKNQLSPSFANDSRSGAAHDSRSGAAHHPGMSEATPDKYDVNTSRDSSAADPYNVSQINNSITIEAAQSRVERKMEEWTDLFSNACGAASPCSAQDLEELFGRERTKTKQLNALGRKPSNLGIAPMRLDEEEEEAEDDILCQKSQQQTPSAPAPERTLSEDSPAERRRQRAQVRQERHEKASASVTHEDFEVTSQQRVLVTQPTTTSILQAQSQLPPPRDTVLSFPPPPPQPPAPLETLLVKEEEAQALERSISELTMRSSYQDVRAPNPNAHNDQRRMAYYAVGRHHRLTSGPRSGGNRRCYFTGKLIFGGGAPFYAGTVQQGLRTLVVFCLPSALGMPHNLPNYSHTAKHGPNRRPSASLSSAASVRTGLLQRSRRTLSSQASAMSMSKAPSRLSSTINLDDMSLSIEGDIDPNWNLDKDYLLSILPEPDEAVLAEMNQRYPEQFETLPVQVRHATCWRLFVKFCFFSGLPIAEGELHYQVRSKMAMEVYGEDIVMSHDVMEAVNGASSAEILKLPNLKTFRYLKKHYQQQSQKLPEVVFQRANWEQVKPEV